MFTKTVLPPELKKRLNLELEIMKAINKNLQKMHKLSRVQSNSEKSIDELENLLIKIKEIESSLH